MICLQEIAEKYPMLRLSVLLEAEKKFIEGDANKDGVSILFSLNFLFSACLGWDRV